MFLGLFTACIIRVYTNDKQVILVECKDIQNKYMCNVNLPQDIGTYRLKKDTLHYLYVNLFHDYDIIIFIYQSTKTLNQK